MTARNQQKDVPRDVVVVVVVVVVVCSSGRVGSECSFDDFVRGVTERVKQLWTCPR